MINTTDILATLASLVGYPLPDTAAVDSFDLLPVFLDQEGELPPVRPYLLTQSFRGQFQLRLGHWKYLNHQGSGGNRYDRGMMAKYALPETAPTATGQLFNLIQDPGELTNLYFSQSDQRKRMQTLLATLTKADGGRTAPRNRKPFDWQALGKSGKSD